MEIIIPIVILVGVGIYFYLKNKDSDKEDIPKPVEPPVVEPEEPIEEEPEVPDETPVEPEPEEPIISVIDLTEEDNTEILRSAFNKDNETYHLEKDAVAFVGGILESDEPNWISGIKQGVEIISIKDRESISINGNNATLYNQYPAVWVDKDGDGISDNDNPTEGAYQTKRKFVLIRNSKNVNIYGLNLESGNIIGVEHPDLPTYNPRYAFEHAIDIGYSEKVIIENINSKDLWGDGVYITDSTDVFVKNFIVDGNGRQGGAAISGNRIYIENLQVLNSRRSGFDIEGNSNNNVAENMVITNSSFKNRLLGLPIGGPGMVRNSLIINNTYHGDSIVSLGNGRNKKRENIIFANNKCYNLGTYNYTNNILIDGVVHDTFYNWDLTMGKFINCKNIHIRNVDTPNYGRLAKGGEPMFLVRSVGTPIEEFKIYNNKQKIGVSFFDKKVRADEVEIGQLYVIDQENETNFNAIDSKKGKYILVTPERKATIDDFFITKTYKNVDDLISDLNEFIPNLHSVEGSIKDPIYKVGDKVFKVVDYELLEETILLYNGDLEAIGFKELTVEDLGILNPVIIPEEYKPTKGELESIPFETSDWLEMHWDRLKKRTWKNDYVDDNWKPGWLIK